MATTRATIRSDLRNDLRIDPNGKVWADSVLNQLIHEAEIEVTRRNLTIPELEVTQTFNVSVGTRTYDLATTLSSVFSRLISVIYDVQNVKTYTASTIAFVAGSPATITDTANGFVTAGFAVGMRLQIQGSTSNDGTNAVTVATVAAGTLTLSTGDTLTAEVAGAAVTLVGTDDPDHNISLRRVQDIRDIERNNFNNTLSYPTRYALSKNSLVFDFLPKEADLVEVQYIKLPDLMAADGTNSDIPDELLPLVRLWAQYLAWGQIPGEINNQNNALQRFQRELARSITMRSLNDYQLRDYRTANWRTRNGVGAPTSYFRTN